MVKESEKLIPVIKGGTKTIWGDDLVENHFPSLKRCGEFRIGDYVVYSIGGYDYVDLVKLNGDLVSAKICGVKMSAEEGSGCPENREYEKDCVRENNLINGITFGMESDFLTTSVPRGEDVFSMRYKMVHCKMDEDADESELVDAVAKELIFYGTFDDFYSIEKKEGEPDVILDGNVLFIDKEKKCYWASSAKYYDLAKRSEGDRVFSQRMYLDGTGNTWDGKVYGDRVTFGVVEHDNMLGIRKMREDSFTNSSYKCEKEVFEKGADFSKSIIIKCVYKYEIDEVRDEKYGNFSVNYGDNNFKEGDFYGENKSTGSVSTRLAFY